MQAYCASLTYFAACRRAVCGSDVLWTFFWMASVHRVSEQECSSRRSSLDCGPHAFSWLVDDWLKIFTRPFPDGRGGFLENCCLTKDSIQVALLSAFQLTNHTQPYIAHQMFGVFIWSATLKPLSII
eukprot:1161081-Pelagomonas_calceolata.AAC.3